MSAAVVVAAVLVVGLCAYLIAALLKPEWFE